MKHTIYNSPQKLANENKLILRSSKNNAIIEFVSCVPEMTTQVVTINNIIHGFVDNGMIDFDNNRFPDFDKILAKCRTEPTVEEYKLCETRFPYVLQNYLEDDHVDDSKIEELGFPVDLDECGTSVRQTETITQESRQRAKILTHACQVELRAKRSANLKAEIQCKKDDHMSILEA